MLRPLPAHALYIGLDAGGSKTELLAHVAGEDTPFSLTGPPANRQRLGVDATAGVLADLIEQALAQRPDAVLRAVCAGVAGAGRAEDQARLAEGITALLGNPAAHITVVHDAHIALEAAFEGGTGIIVIVGTGSIVYARNAAGTWSRAGGWGYLLGDEGSGHALGVHGLRAVAHAFDGGPPTHLQALLAQRHGLKDPEALIHAVYREGWPVQQMAPLVVEAATAGDEAAQRILAAQTDALAQQVAWLAARAGPLEKRIALLGGLTHEAFYKDALLDALRRGLPGWSLQRPAHPPIVGALRLALGGGEAQ